MTTESFYVELSSNVFGENTLANFKNNVHLMKPLEGNWEVALVEISYTKSWKNLRNDFVLALETAINPTTVISDVTSLGYFPIKDYERRGIVRSGYYETAIDLCEEIEKEFNGLIKMDVEKMPKFHFDKITRLIHIEPGIHKIGFDMYPHLNMEVSEILGFDTYSPFAEKTVSGSLITADRPADIDSSLKTLYIYSDLVEPQYIGDTKAQLLRTVKVPPDVKFGQQVVVDYVDPHYIPVLINEFGSIEINIRDDTDETILFMFGRTRLKLHFRQKNV